MWKFQENKHTRGETEESVAYMTKTGISVAPQKGLMSSKNLNKKTRGWIFQLIRAHRIVVYELPARKELATYLH